ncbi:MAG: sigma-70 family RNA polymerase sigma factor [Clostridia bacterium]|nr:sigma-70 family RNA polymerase sigma factor [Clostridia bacterium]
MRTENRKMQTAADRTVVKSAEEDKNTDGVSGKRKYDPDAENKALALVEQIRNGDEEAFRMLTVQYKQLVDSMANRFAPSLGLVDTSTNADGIGMEELRQDGYVALYKAAMSYAPGEEKKGKAVRFGLYAKICIRNAYISEVRRYKRTLRRIEKEKETTGAKLGRLEWIQNNMQPAESEREDSTLLKAICDTLSPYEKTVFMQYIEGKPPREIAVLLNRSERSVSNAIYRIKRKNKGLLTKSP